MDAKEKVTEDRSPGKVWALPLIFLVLELVGLYLGGIGSALLGSTWLRSGIGWWTAGQAQGFLPPKELTNVRVVDISKLKRVPTSTPGVTATSRDELYRLIDVISTAKPKGIAVDIDLSMEWVDDSGKIIEIPQSGRSYKVAYSVDSSKGDVNDRDLDLSFQMNLKGSESSHPPVYLGVGRQIEQDCKTWFSGAPDDWGCKVGASMLFLRETSVVVPRSHWLNGKGSKVDSLSGRLAALLAQRPGAEDDVRTSYGDSTFESAIVDYSPIDTIETLKGDVILSKGLSDSDRTKLNGSLVLLGNCDPKLSKKEDLYVVPNHGSTVFPGVLLHACATQTLVAWPLVPMTHEKAAVIEWCLFGGTALLLFLFEIWLASNHRMLFWIWVAVNLLAMVAAYYGYVYAAQQWRVVWVGIYLLFVIHVVSQITLKIFQTKARQKFEGGHSTH